MSLNFTCMLYFKFSKLHFSLPLPIPHPTLSSFKTINNLRHTLPPFSLLRDFSFQNTSEHFAIRFRQSYLIWEVYRNWIEFEGIRMAPNYPVNLRWRVIYWLVRGFRVVDVARILHVWYFDLSSELNTRSVDYPMRRMVSVRWNSRIS